jgi:peptide/nickel transport system substrate-binding protein
MRLGTFWSIVTACGILFTGCAGVEPGGQGQAPAGAAPSVQPKQLVVGSREAVPVLNSRLDSDGDVTEELVSAGLVGIAPMGEPVPVMAEAVPSLDNNLWRVLPDGRMETTWKLKDGLKWHDGAPVTVDDVLFAVRVGQDRELPEFGHAGFRSLAGVRALDARTIVAEWKEPYILADNMFSFEFALPLPRHLLEDTYLNNKEAFTRHPYWTYQFVHAGPFMVREFAPKERLLLEANPDFALGRPKFDEVEVRFIPDTNTLIANVLSGEVDLIIGGRSFSVAELQQAAASWSGGKMDFHPPQATIVAWPQFMNSDPPAQLDVRFRRALAHAIDRQELNNLVTGGLAPTTDFIVPPGAPEFAAVAPSVVQYPYDPRRAAQLLEDAGYPLVGDTRRDAQGKELSIEVMGNRGGDNEQATLFLADSWRRVGVKGEPRIGDFNREAQALRSGFRVRLHDLSMAQPRKLTWFHSSEIPTADNRFRGNNFMRYVNPELDALIDRFFVTVPPPERVEVMKHIARHVTDQAVEIALYYVLFPTLISHRVQNVTPRTTFAQTWQAHRWDFQ